MSLADMNDLVDLLLRRQAVASLRLESPGSGNLQQKVEEAWAKLSADEQEFMRRVLFVQDSTAAFCCNDDLPAVKARAYTYAARNETYSELHAAMTLILTEIRHAAQNGESDYRVEVADHNVNFEDIESQLLCLGYVVKRVKNTDRTVTRLWVSWLAEEYEQERL